MLPVAHETFLNKALPILSSDPRLVGVAAAGSWITKNMDELSDIDLVVVAARKHYEEVMRDKMRLIAGLGTLLSGFTGEHVGEPRVGICLFGDPLIHVDLKFSPKHAPGASPPERGDPRSALDVLSSLPARRVTVTFTAFSVRAGRRGVAGPGQTTMAFMCRSPFT
ncbi:MAG TPA: hypothetical protein VE093_07125 [Polyangiaceae bacterium]|nr:hypothetical protein [Polyangiaceae bacterium]